MRDSNRIKSLYEQKFGNDLSWENLQQFIPQLFEEERKEIASEYQRKTTLSSGKFVGDKRIISLIKGDN